MSPKQKKPTRHQKVTKRPTPSWMPPLKPPEPESKESVRVKRAKDKPCA